MLKSLIGAVIVGADIVFGMAAPETFRALHKEAHSHLYGTVAFYVLLVILTAWVVMSVVRQVSGGKKPAAGTAPARQARPFSQYGGPR